MSPAIVDSHCHLPLIEGGLESILARAAAAGVEHMLCVSVDLESYAGVRDLARAYQQISCSVGVHPNTDTPVREPTLEDAYVRLVGGDHHDQAGN